jgi:hypothetical protein
MKVTYLLALVCRRINNCTEEALCFLGSQQLPNHLRNDQNCVETEGSLLYSQGNITDPYPGLNDSSAHPTLFI